MYLVNATLIVALPVSETALRNHLMDSATPDDGLEHIYAEVGSSEARVVLFVRQDTPAAAARTAAQLCRRTIDACPPLAGWSLVNCVASTSSPIPPWLNPETPFNGHCGP